MSLSRWWRRGPQAHQHGHREVDPGLEVFEAPHLLLLHTILIYHSALTSTGWAPRVLIVRMARIPSMNRKGARAIKVLAGLCQGGHTRLILSDVQQNAWRGLAEEGVLDEVGPGNVFPRWEEALARAQKLLGTHPK